MRLRCLHDDYDYSSASIFTVQDKSDILGAVVFATDRGETHISLDRLKDATITDTDLRIRLQFEGAIERIKFAAHSQDDFERPFAFLSGPVDCRFKIAHAVFGDFAITSQMGRDSKTTLVDIILYSGPEKKINFGEIDQAAIVFGLSLDRQGDSEFSVQQSNSSVTANWKNMSLTVPTKPMKTSAQRSAASATLDKNNPWKTTPKK